MSRYDLEEDEMKYEIKADQKYNHDWKIANAYQIYGRIEDPNRLEEALKIIFGKDSKELKKYQKEFCNGGKE